MPVAEFLICVGAIFLLFGVLAGICELLEARDAKRERRVELDCKRRMLRDQAWRAVA